MERAKKDAKTGKSPPEEMVALGKLAAALDEGTQARYVDLEDKERAFSAGRRERDGRATRGVPRARARAQSWQSSFGGADGTARRSEARSGGLSARSDGAAPSGVREREARV